MRGRPIALTTHANKVPLLNKLGAADVLLKSDSFSEEVVALTADQGAAVVIDNVGSPLWPQTLRSLAQFGRLVSVGEVGSSPVSLRLAELIFRDAAVIGASGAGRANVEQCAQWMVDGKLEAVIDRVLPLEQFAQGLDLVRSGSAFGRVVFKP